MKKDSGWFWHHVVSTAFAFGIVAMVAMTPLITIQVLGFKAIATNKLKNRMMMRRIQDADDEQIIDFV